MHAAGAGRGSAGQSRTAMARSLHQPPAPAASLSHRLWRRHVWRRGHVRRRLRRHVWHGGAHGRPHGWALGSERPARPTAAAQRVAGDAACHLGRGALFRPPVVPGGRKRARRALLHLRPAAAAGQVRGGRAAAAAAGAPMPAAAPGITHHRCPWPPPPHPPAGLGLCMASWRALCCAFWASRPRTSSRRSSSSSQGGRRARRSSSRAPRPGGRRSSRMACQACPPPALPQAQAVAEGSGTRCGRRTNRPRVAP